MCQVVLLFLTAVIVPLRTGFDIQVEMFSGFFFFDLVSDLYFYTDIVVNFRTAFYNKHGDLILSTRKIACEYLQGWFVIDVLSCLPVHYAGYIVEFMDSSGGSPASDSLQTPGLKMMKILRLFRLAKMLRLLRLKRIMNRYADVIQPFLRGILMFKLVIMLVYLSHFLGCFLYLVGNDSQDELCLTDDAGNQINCTIILGWVQQDDGATTTGWTRVLEDGTLSAPARGG